MLKRWLEWLGIAAAIVTIAAFGYALGIRESDEVRDLKEREATLLGELARAQSPGPASSPSTANPPEPSANEPTVNDTLRKITVARGDTGEVKGELSIAVPSITVAYKPFRYVVSARVSGAGSQDAQKDLKVGERLRFGAYDIQLLSADLNKARFALQKL